MNKNLPMEIVNKILKMKSDLEEMPVYSFFTDDGREKYKINRVFIHKKLEVLYEFKKKNPVRKIYTAFYQTGTNSQIGYGYCYTFHPLNTSHKLNTSIYDYSIKYEYIIQYNLLGSHTIFLKYKKNNCLQKDVFMRGWISLNPSRNNVSSIYPIIDLPKRSEILFYPNRYYDYITMNILDSNVKESIHFCSQFFYSFRSRFFKNYDENQQTFVFKCFSRETKRKIYGSTRIIPS